MDDGPDVRGRGRRRRVVLLGVVAIILWVVGAALATAVLVVIETLPGTDPGRTPRALVIATGAFVSFAIPAAACTVGWAVARRRRGRGPGA